MLFIAESSTHSLSLTSTSVTMFCAEQCFNYTKTMLLGIYPFPLEIRSNENSIAAPQNTVRYMFVLQILFECGLDSGLL